MFDYKKNKTFDERKAESAKILAKHPNYVPIIIIAGKRAPTIDKHKYLVPAELNLGQYVHCIRKRLKLAPEKALFIMSNSSLPSASTPLSEIYKDNRDEDGFLYLTYQCENTFG